jgi:hypothetical protein
MIRSLATTCEYSCSARVTAQLKSRPGTSELRGLCGLFVNRAISVALLTKRLKIGCVRCPVSKVLNAAITLDDGTSCGTGSNITFPTSAVASAGIKPLEFR